MTNEQVYNAVVKLTQTYNELNDNLNILKQSGTLPTPLYSNGKIFLDGRTTPDFNIEPWNHLENVGNGVLRNYGFWNNNYLLHGQNKIPILNAVQGLPTSYIIFKVKPISTTKDGTFFIHFINDGHHHNTCSVWLCDKEKKKPIKLLGSVGTDKHENYGRGVSFGPLNYNSQEYRYFQWLPFNFDKEDIDVDENGYMYFAMTTGVTNFYFSRWAVAERNTDFILVPSMGFDRQQFGETPPRATYNSLYDQFTLYRFNAGNSYKRVRIPYQRSGKNILLSFLRVDDKYCPPLEICGSTTKTPYTMDNIPFGNFVKLRKIDRIIQSSIHIPSNEVSSNTYNAFGLKLLELDINVIPNERDFYFIGAFTETED